MILIKAHDVFNQDNQKRIYSIINQGGLIVFPTETVYGIGADATNPHAVNSIFKAKGRPSDNPLIVHLADQEDLLKYVENIPLYAHTLMALFWPGPLTLVFNKKDIIPMEVSGGLDTVGIRIPSSKIAQEVIRASKKPICAPSANISGRPSSTQFEHVLEDFNNKVDMMIDGGQVDIGLESTVLDLTQHIPVLLRPGAITKKMIEDALGFTIIDNTEQKISGIPKSPGMKYTHYAPKGKVHLIKGEPDKVKAYILDRITSLDPMYIGLIATHDYVDLPFHYAFDLGSLDHLDEVGRHIFQALRHMDKLNITDIFIPALPDQGLGQAIMNRLLKAAGQSLIEL